MTDQNDDEEDAPTRLKNWLNSKDAADLRPENKTDIQFKIVSDGLLNLGPVQWGIYLDGLRQKQRNLFLNREGYCAETRRKLLQTMTPSAKLEFIEKWGRKK